MLRTRIEAIARSVAVVLLIGWAGEAVGEDVYVVKTIDQLMLVEGKHPATTVRNLWFEQVPHRVVLDGAGEIVIGSNSADVATGRQTFIPPASLSIGIRLDAARDVEGFVYFPQPIHKESKSDEAKIRFKIPASDFSSSQRDEFLRVRLSHYLTLQRRNLPGTAWFRHQVRESSRLLGIDLKGDAANRTAPERFRDDQLQETFALVTGGRAVSENLQLDRVLPTSKPAEATVPLESIAGVTVKEFDWQAHVKEITPKPDTLAKVIPADQHAVFFANFNALTEVLDLINEHGTPIVRLSGRHAEAAFAIDHYQKQMCLPLGPVERVVGSTLISRVALTGGDPYFLTGTDVAVLFESPQPNLLQEALMAQLNQAQQNTPDAKMDTGKIREISYTVIRTPDRRICAYLATVGNCNIVTNSPVQLERLIDAHENKTPSLDELPEYTYFRHRYAAADGELAFLILSDATIRRWCGPRWRIGTSRRTRAVAVMSEVQAKYGDQIVTRAVPRGEVPREFWVSEGDTLTMTERGVLSSTYGTLGFQTPISELKIDRVTAEEARLYERWRNGYQQYWSTFFDPIAARVSSAGDKLAIDLSVMPLITRTDYAPYIELSKGAKIGNAGDPHADSLAHVVLAINPDSELLRSLGSFAQAMAPQFRTNPLSWLGNAVSLYADQDPFWAEAAKSEDIGKFLEKNYYRFPIALRAEVRDGLKLTVFLAALRAYVDQTAPGMSLWENLTHQDTPYVKISQTERARSDNEALRDAAVYYVASGSAFLISTSENMIKRAIERENDRRKRKENEKEQADSNAWLGDSLGLKLDGEFSAVLAGLFHDQYQRISQMTAWSNIPILNEWKQRYPDRDPLEVHEQLWGDRLVCPSGGSYRWNEKDRTMESNVYGHPWAPKSGPAVPPILGKYSKEEFGVTFEEHGLRARAELQRKK